MTVDRMPLSFLDIHTLMLVLTLASALLGAMLLLIWATQKTYPGFGRWAVGTCLISLSIPLLIMRGIIPDFLSIILADTLLLTAQALILEGVRSFRDVPQHPKWDAAFIIIPLLSFLYYTYVEPNLSMRIIIYSFFSAILLGLSAWELMRKPPTLSRFQLLFTGLVLAISSFIMLIRTIATIITHPYHDFFAPHISQSLTFLLMLLFGILWPFGFVMLNNRRLEQDLMAAQDELWRLATTDYLTGIANSRTFAEKGAQEIQRARRYGRTLAALMIDLDLFKRLNDAYGHAVGDKVLVTVASVFKSLLRDVDICARLGGEEFGILLPETDEEGPKRPRNGSG